MRCAVIAAVLLLVYIQDAAAESVSSMCKNKYPAKDCGGGWYRIDPFRCAKYFTAHKHFQEAENDCVRLGGHVVSLHSGDDFNNVLCLALRATNTMNPFWLGGKVWFSPIFGEEWLFGVRWTDGTPDDFNRWYSWQPDYPSEECIEMNYDEWGAWNNLECSLTRPYVCAIWV